MSTRRPQSPMVRLFGTLLPRLLFLATPLALGACSDTSTPLAPENQASSPSDYAGGIGQRPVVGRIAFTSYRNDVTSKGDIYLMNPDGSNLTRLTSGADDERMPAWSWNNQQIAYVRNRPANFQSLPDVYVVNFNGTGGHWLSPVADGLVKTEPAWSPDGTRIVVTRGGAYLGWVDVVTGQYHDFQTRAGSLVGSHGSYSKDGSRIVFSQTNNISVMSANGSGITKLIGAPGLAFFAPAYSPDGTKIAFVSDMSGPTLLYVMNADGTGVTPLTSTSGDKTPSWSPDGKKIAFARMQGGSLVQVWSINADGSNLAPLTQTNTWELTPAYSH